MLAQISFDFSTRFRVYGERSVYGFVIGCAIIFSLSETTISGGGGSRLPPVVTVEENPFKIILGDASEEGAFCLITIWTKVVDLMEEEEQSPPNYVLQVHHRCVHQ